MIKSAGVVQFPCFFRNLWNNDRTVTRKKLLHRLLVIISCAGHTTFLFCFSSPHQKWIEAAVFLFDFAENQSRWRLRAPKSRRILSRVRFAAKFARRWSVMSVPNANQSTVLARETWAYVTPVSCWYYGCQRQSPTTTTTLVAVSLLCVVSATGNRRNEGGSCDAPATVVVVPLSGICWLLRKVRSFLATDWSANKNRRAGMEKCRAKFTISDLSDAKKKLPVLYIKIRWTSSCNIIYFIGRKCAIGNF